MYINYKLSMTIILAGILYSSCCREDVEQNISTESYLIFGHFYGECLGEQCVEIFKLENEKLFEDLDALYPNSQSIYSGEFTELEDNMYQLAKDLVDYIPEELLESTENVFGCPDCADQGGLYIEYKSGILLKHWMIDQSKTGVPGYLHEFMDKVNEKIELINED